MRDSASFDAPPTRGAEIADGGVRFSVEAPSATSVHVCLYDDSDAETARHRLSDLGNGLFSVFVADLGEGARYGFRADGPWQPDKGHRFDPSKLLVDPYARRIDRPFVYDPRLGEHGTDTAELVPKAIVEHPLAALPAERPDREPGGLIYELPVRAFTLLHPDIPRADRGTLRALTYPPVIEHLRALHVSAVELMPVAAWIDERHLAPLGLSNAWGYNPVTMLALDPRLAPGGIADLRAAVAALHAAGIGVILDVVFNHTGESDTGGPTLSLRGLSNATYYRHDANGTLINDTGCGNTLACDRPEVQDLVLAAMRHFVTQAGIDGFRFDLAPILGRNGHGFSAEAQMLRRIEQDPVLATSLLIAEPWDIGPGGYQLGNFGPRWLEWNDHARDDIRRFWRGDAGLTGMFATRLAGSSNIFGKGGASRTRSVNFVAAHDGFSLTDIVAYETKHNEANGEDNRDGHNDNCSWNNGVEGPSDDPAILAAREADARALIASLFASRGAILLTAGDEFGHSQGGNNNAYAQDNALTWRDWGKINEDRLAFTRAWAEFRAKSELLTRSEFLEDATDAGDQDHAAWLTPEGEPMTAGHWEDGDRKCFTMVLGKPGERIAIAFNRGHTEIRCRLPASPASWRPATPGANAEGLVPPRAVLCWQERPA
ncbi:glycogen debranching enzyme [Hoeflea olei]|uniref:Glycogen debranching enzyme n=2 Tax=Hoeflea olei TaxID=1480615 RepID=A0A1C1Z0U4_9HYPH|nr:glycogen debranching protein GlgX [Hoeflea olei]OCW59388.1 glycogen debranching enzyme [Hoeflea olei]